MGRIKHDVMFRRWRYQLNVRQLQCLAEFVREQLRAEVCYKIALLFHAFVFENYGQEALGANFSVYSCLLFRMRDERLS